MKGSKTMTKQIELSTREINKRQYVFVLTDLKHNIVCSYCATKERENNEIWVVVDEDGCRVDNFFLEDCTNLYSRLRDFVEWALIDFRTKSNFDFIVNRETLKIVSEINTTLEALVL